MKTIDILKVEYIGDLSIKVYFKDKSSIVNIGDYITKNPHPQYNKYLQEKNLKKFKLENGNVVWGKNWDLIFPLEHLYSGVVN